MVKFEFITGCNFECRIILISFKQVHALKIIKAKPRHVRRFVFDLDFIFTNGYFTSGIHR